MDELHLDFSDVQEFETIPNGVYNAVVDKVDLRTSEGGGKYLAFRFNVLSAPYVNQKAFMNASLQKTAMWSLRRTLRALGYAKEDLQKEDFPLRPEDLLELPCRLRIVLEEYEGEPRSKVDRVLPPGDDAVTSVAVGTPEDDDEDLFKF